MKTKIKADPKKAMERLRKMREFSDRYGGPTKSMTEDEVILSIKKYREDWWKNYLASRP